MAGNLENVTVIEKKGSGMVQSQIKESKTTKKLNAMHYPGLERGGGGW